VQINGKLRSKILVSPNADEKSIEADAKADVRIAELLAGKQIVKTIIVPGRLANFVIKS
jgi:leucyl-tRNA synthetase